QKAMDIKNKPESPAGNNAGVAIIGMAGRFPGADTIAALWENLKAGVESVSHFSKDELEAQDASAQEAGQNYIRARSVLPNADMFDPAFFNIQPKEAEQMDPQHRIFLECCWDALESAGYDSHQYPG